MANNEEIKFDPNCGISEEEQREIFTQINTIAEKNRRSLAAAADGQSGKSKKRGGKTRFKAKKSGGLFPVLVNIAAIAALAGGFFVLSGFQGKTDAQVREGTKIYNTAERALFQEIRKETSVSEQDDFARNEMERLSHEQSQAATVEAQMGAFFANLNNRISENRFDEAAEIIRSMRNFLNTPSFQNLRSIQTRKDIYTQAINSCEMMLEEARKNSGISAADNDSLAELQKINIELEQNLAEKDKTIADLTSKTSDIDALRTKNNDLEAGSAQKNDQIRDLQNQNTTLNQTVAARNTTISRINDVVGQEKDINDMTFNEIRESLIRIQNALNNN